MNRIIVIGTLSAVALFVESTAGQAPLGTAFTYQGRLENAGQPVSGPVNVVFKLYDAAAAGNLQGTQTLNGMSVTGGHFTATLNANAELGPAAFNGERRWLEISVNGTPLLPRQEVTAAPYALQTRGIFVSDFGNVGIGNTNPVSRLAINGGLYLNDDLDEDVVFRTGNYSIRNGDNNNLAYRYMSDPEQHDFFIGGANRLSIASNGNVGIGTVGPTTTLDVAGTSRVMANASIGLDASNASTLAGAMAIRGVESGLTGNTYGIFGVANSTAGIGVYGRAAAATGATYGIYGTSTSPSGIGVYGQSADNVAVRGEATATTGINYGVFGSTTSTSGRGVYANATASTGSSYAFYGLNSSDAGIAVYGSANSNTGDTYAVYGTNSSTTGTGVFGRTTTTTGQTFGVYGESRSSSGSGVYGEATAASGQTFGVRGVVSSTGGWAVTGFASSTTGTTYGVRAQSNSSAGYGVFGFAPSQTGVTYGVYGEAWSDDGFGVYSDGDFAASGTKAFRIDHPDDPANKYLFHYAAESPVPQNFYSGNAVTDEYGYAWVALPGYFEAINANCKYQLTVVDGADSGGFVQVKVSSKIRGNRFQIRTSEPNVEVSWRVEADRNDAHVRLKKPREVVEKQGLERGKYQHPEFYGQPPEKGMEHDAEASKEAARTTP